MTAKIPAPKLSKIKTVDSPTDEAAPAAKPKTTWDKVLMYTPVVVTVIATLLAGLSNSELNAAQYERSWAAQLQSKIADQWNFFQVKRIRGSALDNTVEILQGVSHPAPLDVAEFKASVASLWDQAAAWSGPGGSPRAESTLKALRGGLEDLRAAINSPTAEQALGTLAAGTGPVFTPKPIEDASIRAAIAAIESRKPDAETAALVRAVSVDALLSSVRTAEDNTAAFDAAIGATNKSVEAIRAAISQVAGAVHVIERVSEDESSRKLVQGVDRLAADFTAARLRYSARRYDQEATLNKDIAQLTEIRVRQSNLIADHHKERSQLFFFGMIIAQAAVIAATMALAVRQKSLLWGLATVACLIAVSFGVYVRFYV